ncbi:MAG: efflux RND transporter periplasmic adaptor subunit [Acidocella sp.]|nr:efflux RND transporter periplasmic adaptor subunit [Acidocella sp.]
MKLCYATIFLLLFGSMPARVAAAQKTPPDVGYIIASTQPVYDQQSYVGRIQAPQIVNIQARITGFLTSQNFTDGQFVHKGQILYVIEQPPYQALLTQAQAAVAQAQAQARNADVTLARARALLRTPAGQQSSVDQAQATALSDEAAILSAQAKLQTAQINLGYTEIRAPIDGIIGATAVTPGNVVSPSSGTLATIVSDNPMYVTFALPMADAIKDRPMAARLRVQVRLPNGEVYGQTGTIDFINNQVTADTDTLAWRATIANPAHELTDGEFITVALRAAKPKSQIVIPLAALIDDQLGDYVLEVGPGDIVKRQNITPGTQTATDVVITAGISPGAKVITDGLQRIHPGLKVIPQLAEPN